MFGRKYLRLIFSVGFFITISCSPTKYLDKREKALGTTGKNNWSFHRLSDRDKGTTLAFPGYIITIEKSKRSKIGAPSKKDIHKNGALKMFGFKPEIYTWKELSWEKKMILDDPKPTFVSSIVQFKLNTTASLPNIEATYVYNAYDKGDLANSKNAYHRGYSELEEFGDYIVSEVKNRNITHVFLFSMGWNTDQQEAIRNFNSLFLRLLKRSKPKEKSFKPLFIGLTWPSQWPIPVISLLNKTNDADEIGMIWANILLNKKLLAVNQEDNFKTIAIGHSLGAKLTSRATMSASMLNQETKPLDLLINIQSAYSINRFSIEDHPETTIDYREWQKYANKIALTWSDFDGATKKSFWAPYAGASSGYRKVFKNPKKFPTIELKVYNETDGLQFNKRKQFYLIDATSIIKRKAYKKGGNAHSDIYNAEVAEMLWKLIETATF